MLNFYRNSLICLLILLIPGIVSASDRIKDADAVITMHNGNPCFSYPQDKEIWKRPYLFAYLSVSENGSHGGVQWEIQMASPDGKGLLAPNTPETCIEYSVLSPGTKVINNPRPLALDTPYYVHINVGTPPGRPRYERKFRSDFCISCNERGEKVLVGADWNDKAGGWKCLKPGESPKRSFWERLFGE